MVQALSTNTFGTAKWIVSSDPTQGTHTTIASALTSASSGDTIFIRPGTYTENLTLKAGVNLTAYTCDSLTPNVTILGKCTFTAAGTVSITGIALETNSDYFLEITGSAASVVNFKDCTLICANNTGINHTSSNAGSIIGISNSGGNIETTGITLFTSSSAGQIVIINSSFVNGGGSTTASTKSAGGLSCAYAGFQFPISTSGTAQMTGYYCLFQTGNVAATAVTVGGTGAGDNEFIGCTFAGDTATALTITSAAVVTDATVSSTNAAAVGGAGTISYTPIAFSRSGKTNSVTTKSPINYGLSVVTQVFTSDGTYTPTKGMVYCVAEVVGGGGGGGGVGTTTGAQYASAGGGGGGGYARKTISAATIGASQSVTIGAAGTAGSTSGGNGGSGGTTSLGSIISATGGSGGTGMAGSAGAQAAGGAGGAGSSGDFNTNGNPGGSGVVGVAGGVAFPGYGGSTYFGGGAIGYSGSYNVDGSAATTSGGGGGGGINVTSQVVGRSGGVGVKGIVVITEYVIS